MKTSLYSWDTITAKNWLFLCCGSLLAGGLLGMGSKTLHLGILGVVIGFLISSALLGFTKILRHLIVDIFGIRIYFFVKEISDGVPIRSSNEAQDSGDSL